MFVFVFVGEFVFQFRALLLPRFTRFEPNIASSLRIFHPASEDSSDFLEAGLKL